MTLNRSNRIALYAAAGIGLFVSLVSLLFAVEQRRAQAQTGAVLSAFFSQEVLHDMDTGSRVEIVIQRHPKCWFCGEVGDVLGQSWFARSLKLRQISLSDPWFARSSRVTRLSFFVNSIFSVDISTDLRLPPGARAVFLDPTELKITKNDWGFFVVSHIGLNLNKTEALFYFDHFCPGLCGGGEYVLTEDRWHLACR
jgi:hypothetical protein